MVSRNITRSLLTNFTAGEFSPRIYGRVDYNKYFNAAKTLRNMLVFPHGGVTKRHGMEFIAETKDSSKKARLVEFSFSVVQKYILEFGDQYIRFYMNGGQIIYAPDPENPDELAPYEIASPYLGEDLPLLKFAQDADVLYIVHPDYQPMQLIRHDHDNWELVSMSLVNGPFLDMNTTDITLTLSSVNGSTGLTGQTVRVTASSDLFTEDDVDRWIRIDYVQTADLISNGRIDPSAAGVIGGPWDVDGEWEISGAFNGVADASRDLSVAIEYSVDNGTTWSTYDSFKNAASTQNVIINGVLLSEDYGGIVPKMRLYADGNTNLFAWSLRYAYKEKTGYLQISEYESPTSVLCTVKRKCSKLGTPLRDWYLGAFGVVPGWPYTITFHQGRLYFGGVDHAPQKVFGSRVGKYEDFESGPDDDMAVTFELASNEVNVIKWITSKGGIVVGTEGAEWIINAGSASAPITPSNVYASKETAIGSSSIQPVIPEGAVVYVQNGGHNLRQMLYQYINDKYTAVDLSLLSEHLLRDAEIIDMDLQTRPYTTIWLVLSNGMAVAVTMLSDEQVLAWCPQVTDGDIESVRCLNEEVWFIVKRIINGQTKRYVERIVPWDETLTNMSFMDCWAQYTGRTAVITGITQGNPPVVTAPDHGFSNGDMVLIYGVQGMTQVNRRVFKVQNATENTFELFDTDASGYSPYTGGGIVQACAHVLSGLDYLEGKEVNIVYDGLVHPNKIVSDGTITLDEGIWGGNIRVGLPYTPIIETLNLEIPMQSGTLQGLTKRITKVIARLYKTISIKASSDGVRFETLSFRDTAGVYGGVYPELYTGDKTITLPSGFSPDQYIYITQDEPLPLTLTMLIAEMEIE